MVSFSSKCKSTLVVVDQLDQSLFSIKWMIASVSLAIIQANTALLQYSLPGIFDTCLHVGQICIQPIDDEELPIKFVYEIVPLFGPETVGVVTKSFGQTKISTEFRLNGYHLESFVCLFTSCQQSGHSIDVEKRK